MAKTFERREPTLDTAWLRKPQRAAGRNFAAAQPSRLFNWAMGGLPVDEYLRRDLVNLRSHSRDQSRNNDYMKAFLRMVARNIIGPQGVQLQMRVKDPSGSMDKRANDLIEESWAKWGQVGTTTVCGRFSWRDLEKVAVRTVARDGEILIREVRGFKNGFGYALQLIEADHLDERLNEELPNGGEIRMGVEKDKWGRPVAYHVKVKDRLKGNRHERIPAEEVIHLFLPEDPNQTRGWPWAHTAMRRLNMLGGYEEAALVAARVGASKMGFFVEREDGPPTAADSYEKDADGNLITDADPGTFELLPQGLDFKAFDPAYPNGEMPGFLKAMLRGAAAGLGVSYNAYAGDLEGVNFSSLRGGLLEERDEWQVLQQWVIGRLHARIFRNWLEQALLYQAVALPLGKFEKFHAPNWLPRRWQWVDPEKEVNAMAKEVALGVNSRRRIAAAMGRDLEEVFEELAQEQELASKAGLTLTNPATGSAAPASQPTEGNSNGEG